MLQMGKLTLDGSPAAVLAERAAGGKVHHGELQRNHSGGDKRVDVLGVHSRHAGIPVDSDEEVRQRWRGAIICHVRRPY